MLTFAVFGLLCYIAQSASKIEASWSFCTGKDATECPYGKYANISGETFTPNPPPVGANVCTHILSYNPSKSHLSLPIVHNNNKHSSPSLEWDIPWKQSQIHHMIYKFKMAHL